jgi:iron complex outermembrane recepter protein
MRFLITVSVMVVLAMSAKGQFTVKGTVFDARDGVVLPGANVVVDGTFKGVHSGSDGSFILRGVPPGSHQLSISFLGYETVYVPLEVAEDLTINVGLPRAAFLTQEVVVKATRADSRTPSARTDISRDYIRANNLGQDIPYLLSLTPGLTTSSDAGTGIGYTWMKIRGSDDTRINVTVNGIPVNDAESHGVWWVNMPDIASSTDNIQIQRGVGTSTQGAASFGATISIETNQLQENAYAEVITTGGSFNTLRNTVNLGTGLMDNGWSFDGRLSKSNSDGFIDRSFSDLKSFYLSGGYYGENTAVRAIVFSGKEKTYQAWYGVPGTSLDSNRTYNPAGLYFDAQGNKKYYENETDNYQQDHYQLHLTHRFGPELVGNASLHYTYGRGYYEQYRQRQRFSNYGLPNVLIDSTLFTRTDLVRQRWLDNDFYGLTYSMNYNSMGRLWAIFGGGYNIYDGNHFGEIVWASLAKSFEKGYRYYDNQAQKKDFNSFLKMNYELFSGFYVFGDLQYRNIIYDFEGKGFLNDQVVPLDQTAVYHFWNPKAGFVYDLNSFNNLYLFLGISNREPVRRDFTESSPESRPRHETLRNIELGYKYRAADFVAGANYYLMDYKDQLILTGEINDVGGFSRANIDKSYRMGLELEAAYKMNELIEFSGNLSISRNKIPEFTEVSDTYDADGEWIGVSNHVYTHTDIAFSPNLVGSGRLTYFPVKDASIAVLSKYVSDQYIDNTMHKDRMLNSYWVNDLRFSYTFRNSFFRELELSLAVNNIFDVDYITNAWIYKGVVGDMGLTTLEDGYFPQAGIHLLAGLRLRL